MPNDETAPELQLLRDVACLRLEDVIVGLMAYGLDRSATIAVLEDAMDHALEEAYGTTPPRRAIGVTADQ